MTECTTLKDSEDKPWCSTKVDENGHHVSSGGYWGQCGQHCDETQLEIQNEELSLKDGKSFNHWCTVVGNQEGCGESLEL